MFIEQVAAGAGLLLMCWLLGLPVILSLAAWRYPEVSRPYLAGLAPAVGLAVLSIVTVGLYMFVGATKTWGLASAIVLGLAAVAGLAWLGVTRRSDLKPVLPAVLIALAISFLVFAVWTVPQLLSGPDSTFIRSNPSDTMMYVSLSESTRVAGLQQIIDGRSLAEIPATSALLNENPTALYSARMVGGIMRLGTFNIVGWLSQISGIGVEHLLWIFGAACVACLASATFSVARLLGGPIGISIGASAASALCYWVGISADADAFSSLHVLPMIAAFTAAMVLLPNSFAVDRAGEEQHSARMPWLDSAILGGLLLGAIFISYVEIAPFVVIALFASIIVWTIQFRFSLKPATAGLVTLVVAFAVIVASGQLFYLVGILTRQLSFAMEAAGAIGSYASDRELSQNAVSAVMGFAWVDQLAQSFRISSFVGSGVEWLLSILTLLIGIGVGCLSLLPKGARLTFVSALVGALFAAALYGFLGKGDTYWVLKTMSISAPFVVLLVASASAALDTTLSLRAGIFATVASVICLIGISGFGLGRLVDDLGRRVPVYTANVHQGHSYNVSKVVAELDRRCPCKLIVNLPPEADWWRAMYFAKSFQRFQPFPQMGVFFDNKPVTLSVTKLNPVDKPEYAVVSIKGDYVGPGKLGELIVEQSGVRLYAIKGGTAADFGPRPVGD